MPVAPRVVVPWQMCTTDPSHRVVTPLEGVQIEVRLPGFPNLCPLPYPAIVIHVVVDWRIPLGVPYIANRGTLAQRTLTEDMDLRYVDFVHRHIATEAHRFVGLPPEQLQLWQDQHISAGLFVCHPADILVVKGWRECERRWLSLDTARNRYTDMTQRGRNIRFMWPWVGEFATVCLL